MKKTVIFILILVIAIVVFDFYIVFAEGPEASISATYIRWSYNYPSIVFLLGYVMGHLNWRMTDKRVYGDKEKK